MQCAVTNRYQRPAATVSLSCFSDYKLEHGHPESDSQLQVPTSEVNGTHYYSLQSSRHIRCVRLIRCIQTVRFSILVYWQVYR